MDRFGKIFISGVMTVCMLTACASDAALIGSTQISQARDLGDDHAQFLAATVQDEFVPPTTWREVELEESPEPCNMTVLAASTEKLQQDLVSFLNGTQETVSLSAGSYVLLSLGGEYILQDLDLAFEGQAPQGDLRITDSSATFDRAMYSLEEVVSKTAWPDLSQRAAYLCIEFEENATLQQLQITGIPSLYLAKCQQAESEITLSATDPKNPLSDERVAIPKSVYLLADLLLDGSHVKSDHQKIMVFMDYLAQFHYANGPDNVIMPFSFGTGECGNFSYMLAALAATQGIDSRIITMANYPVNNGHVVAELFVDGEWQCYDPTNASYYTTTPTDVEHPDVLSFEELRDGEADDNKVTCVILAPERLGPGYSASMSDEELKGLLENSFLGPAIYEKADPAGPIGPGNPLTYSFVLSPDQKPAIFAQDGEQGFTHIGAAYINGFHRYRLEGLDPESVYTLQIKSYGVISDTAIDQFDAAASASGATIQAGNTHQFDNQNADSMLWEITFDPDSTSAELLLSHKYTGPEYRYITIEEVRLLERSET